MQGGGPQIHKQTWRYHTFSIGIIPIKPTKLLRSYKLQSFGKLRFSYSKKSTFAGLEAFGNGGVHQEENNQISKNKRCKVTSSSE